MFITQIHAQYDSNQEITDLSSEISNWTQGISDINGFSQLFSGITPTSTIKESPIILNTTGNDTNSQSNTQNLKEINTEDLGTNKEFFEFNKIEGVSEITNNITKQLEKNLIIKDWSSLLLNINTGTTQTIKKEINKRLLQLSEQIFKKGDIFKLSGTETITIQTDDQLISQVQTINTLLKQKNTIPKGKLILSGVQEIIVRKGSWNGQLLAPEQLSVSDIDKLGQKGLPKDWKNIEIFSVGSTGASLGASGANFLIEYKVTDKQPGTTLEIYRSDDGKTWSTNAPDTSCKLDENNICSFYTDHFTTFTVGGTFVRNNMSYLDSGFWTAGPTSTNIVNAIYGFSLGDTTAYTSGWIANSCNPVAISVVYVAPGVNTLPNTLLANTVYVLSSGSYITNYRENGMATLFNGNCTAVVGIGDVTLYSTVYNTDFLYASNKSNIVIDNINIDGESNGTSYKQNRNLRGIILFTTSSNNTINKVKTYNTQSLGIQIGGNYNKITNTTSYNNVSYGLYINGSYNSLENINSYNNSAYGLYLATASYSTFKNIKSYNNGYGFYINSSSYNLFNYIWTYNNYAHGIRFQSSVCVNNTFNNFYAFNNTSAGLYTDNVNISRISINNAIFANNGTYGLSVNSTSGVILNNVIVYNNGDMGIYLATSPRDVFLNNILTFNNGSRGIYANTTLSYSKFYGYLKSYYNYNNTTIYNTAPLGILTGTSSEMSSFGWTEGLYSIPNTIPNCNDIVNIKNKYNNYFTNRETGCRNIRGRIPYRGFNDPLLFVYGSGITKQIQPLKFNNTTFSIETYGTAGGEYTPTKYITEFNGYCSDGNSSNNDGCDQYGQIESGYTCNGTSCTIIHGDGLIISGAMAGAEACDDANTIDNDGCSSLGIIENGYSCYGTTSLCFKYGDGIIGSGEICDDANTTNNDGCSATGQVENNYICAGTPSSCSLISSITNITTGDLNSTYRANNPSKHNIILSLFGTGSFYTKDRKSNLCKISNFTKVIEINPGYDTIPELIDTHTIYILNSGNYIVPHTISLMGNCNALIGKGEINIYNPYTLTQTIYNNRSGNNNILENIKINGESNGSNFKRRRNSYGIYIYSGSNNTLNNIVVQSNASHGIYLNITAPYNKLYNITTYNNIGGAGLYIGTNTNYTLVNNIKTYNNMYGIYIIGPAYNTINNALVFNNNSYGVYFNGSYNTLNNAAIYNNQNYGLYINAGSTNFFNNLSIHNNNYIGIYLLSTSANYFNNLSIYNNTLNSILQSSSSNNKYYGQLSIFQNGNNTYTGIIAGGSEYSSLGMIPGYTGNMDLNIGCDKVIFTNNISKSETFLDVSNNCSTRGNGLHRSGSDTNSYRYGSFINKQIQPVIYSGAAFRLYGTIGREYNTSRFIDDGFVYCDDGNLSNNDGCDQYNQVEYGYSCTGYPSNCTTQSTALPRSCNDNNTTDNDGCSSTGQIESGYICIGKPSNCQLISSISGVTTGWLTDTFRNTNPSDAAITLSLFGSGSKYTNLWTSNYCSNANFSIQKINPGLNKIPQFLSGNTIYVLNSGTYIIPHYAQSGVQLSGNCIAIIGKGETNIYSTGTIPDPYGMVYGYYRSNIILDNLKIDGAFNGISANKGVRNHFGIHRYSVTNSAINNVFTSNHGQVNTTSEGIRLNIYSSNNILNNITSFGNYNYGIAIYNYSTNNIVNQAYTFNNSSCGIYSNNAISNTYNNLYGFNNVSYGLYLNVTSNNTVNNSIFSNNGSVGLYINNPGNNFITNTYAFNNNGAGAYLSTTVTTTYFSNITSFNNNGSGIYNTVLSNKFFGYISMFDNIANNIGLVTGGTDFGYLGFSSGTINTSPSTTCNYTSYATNASGVAMLDSSNNCATRNRIAAFGSYTPLNYIYGKNIIKQTQPIRFDGIYFVQYGTTGADFNPLRYITEQQKFCNDTDTTNGDGCDQYGQVEYGRTCNYSNPSICSKPGSITGNVACNDNNGANGDGCDEYGAVEDGFVCAWTLSGGTISFCENISTMTGITTQYFDENYWKTNPSDQNIIVSLFNSGSAYTRIRTSKCNIATITNVKRLSPGFNTIPRTLSGNSVYILNSGTYIINYLSGINLGNNCTAIVANGNTTLYSTGTIGTAYGMIYTNAKSNNIIDNIQIEGAQNGYGIIKTANSYGINMYGSTNNTLNNITVLDNASHGIVMQVNSSFNILNNIYTINNIGQGIYIGSTSNYNIINNIVSLNNTSYGIGIGGNANYNSINNAIIANNQDVGISIADTNYNFFNNILVYNNFSYGISSNSNGTQNKLNNIKSFNNLDGGILFSSTANRFYGNLELFDNTFNITGNISIGGTMPQIGWTTGTFYKSQTQTACDLLPIITTNSGTYTLDNNNNCTNKGKFQQWPSITTMPLKITFGKNTIQQTYPIRYNLIDWQLFGSTGTDYNPNRYVGEFKKSCNDSNTENGDGCDQYGWVENGWSCSGSTCTQNIPTIPSECSDGNTSNGDGCTSTGQIEAGYNCALSGSEASGYIDRCIPLTNITGYTTDYLDRKFRNANPSDQSIVLSLFGSGNKYTKNRTKSCNISKIRVKKVDAGINKVPSSISGNTIYVLNAGSYINTGIWIEGNCAAIVGNGEVTLYSTGVMGQQILIRSKNNIIVDNIKINGTANGGTGTHTANTYGIYMLNGFNNTLNNITPYNNSQGIFLSYCAYNNLSNISSYNNTIGIQIYTSYINTLDSILAYNNSSHGIYLYNASYNTLNNDIAYNNNGVGIYLYYSSSRNSVSNSAAFNNNSYGIHIGRATTASAAYNLLNNNYTYNNNADGILYNSVSNYTYSNNLYSFNNNGYGFNNIGSYNYLFGNNIVFDNVNNTNSLLIGGNILASYGWLGGSFLFSGATDCINTINPINLNGNYLLNKEGNCTNRGKSSWIANQPIKHSYGTNVIRQTPTIQRRPDDTVATWIMTGYGNLGVEYNPLRAITETRKVCNDENVDNGDGCDQYGWTEYGWSCNGTPSLCVRVSDDAGGVLCNDGNSSNGDGCDEYGMVESGFICAGTPLSTCLTYAQITGYTINFFTKNFLSSQANDYTLIMSLFNTGSAYSRNRPSQCNLSNIKISKLNPGKNVLGQLLTGNTIYVLNSGSYTFGYSSGLRLDGNCTAIIGSGDVTLYTTGQLVSDGMFYMDSKTNNIIDNIKIDGWYNGSGIAKATNYAGIYLYRTTNNTFNNIQSYNNQYGILLDNYSNNNYFNNIQTYNNTVHGILIQNTSTRNILNNVYSFNNSSNGIYFNTTSNNSLNNTVSFNNYGAGIQLTTTTNCMLNNTYSFNNQGAGISFTSTATTNFINNTQVYNNNTTGVYNDSTSLGTNKFFGYFKIFNNFDDTHFMLVGTTEFLYLGRNNGQENSGNSESICNISPINTYGTLLFRPSNNCSTRNKVFIWTGTKASYNYRPSFAKQIQPVRFDGNSWLPQGSELIDFDTNKYIGELEEYKSSSTRTIGCSDGNSTNGDGCSATGQVESGYICGMNGSYQCLNISSITNIQTGYLTQNFRNTTPSDHAIILSLFGSGSIYTRYWNSSCNPSLLNVIKVNPGLNQLPKEIASDTIYILAPGNHIINYISGLIITGNCSAIVGNGTVNLYSTGTIGANYGMISANGKSHIIIDNLKINGIQNGYGANKAMNSYGILFNNSSHSTINNTSVYNNDYGIMINSYANNNTISNSKIFNSNTDGLSILSYSMFNTFTNIATFNNTRYGVFLNSVCNYNALNNIAAFNNSSYGLYIANGLLNGISNIISFNNSLDGILLGNNNNNYLDNIISYNNNANGINFQASSTQNYLNNISTYNNHGLGINNSVISNRFYGTTKAFNNINNSQTITTGGSEVSFFGRSTGTYTTQGQINCSKTISIMNHLGISLLDPANACATRGKINAINGRSISNDSISNIFGSEIPQQTISFKHNTIKRYTYGTTGVDFVPNKFVGEWGSNNTIFSGSNESGYVCAGGNCALIHSIPNISTGYLDTSYRNTTPSDHNIILSLFGSGNIYTKLRPTSCKYSEFTIQKINPGFNQIPQTLSGQTIYILNSGNYINNYISGIWLGGNCSAIIGIGEVTLYSTGTIGASYGMIFSDSRSHNIIDNIKINGTQNGLGGTHTANSYGIYLNNSSLHSINNITTYVNSAYGFYTNYGGSNSISNLISYNNSSYGMYINVGFFNILNYIYSFNNTNHGLYIATSTNNQINNTYTYNNGGMGIYTNAGGYNSINNLASFNNNDIGIRIENQTYGYLNNAYSFNNNSHGIYLWSNATNQFLNNVYSFNNNGHGLYNAGGITNKYYGNIKLYSNINNGNMLSQGTGEQAQLNWTTGIFDGNGSVSCSDLPAPTDTSGSNLLDTTNNCANRGRNLIRSTIPPISYSYGANFAKQTQPVIHDILTGLLYGINGINYDTSKFIAEAPKQCGDSGCVIKIPCNDGNTTNGDGCSSENYVENGYLCTGTPSDCKLISSITGVENNKYLTNTYRSASPSDHSIILSLFGTGSVYTRSRPSSCELSKINIQRINPGTNLIPQSITGNTIIVLNSGTHIIGYTNGIQLSGNCSAIVGNGDVSLFSTGTIGASYGMIFTNSKSHTIIDNIKIDALQNGSGSNKGTANNYGIYYYNSSNNTINNITTTKNLSAGIYFTITNNNIINNITTYNNPGYGLYLATSNYNTLNYIYSYNNTNYGVYLNTVSYNTFNNIFSYNNSNLGLYLIGGSYNNLNNTQIFNNNNIGLYIENNTYNLIQNTVSSNNYGAGIHTVSNATNNFFYNVISANNFGSGISNAGGITNKYFGYLKIFANINNTAGTLGQGTLSPIGLNDGTLYTTDTMDCKYLPIPVNISGITLLSGANNCGTRGKLLNWITPSPVSKYLYINNGIKQLQPWRFDIISRGAYGTTGLDFNPIRNINEQVVYCTDGNSTNGDGCDQYGQQEAGRTCIGSSCTKDSINNPAPCSDGNSTNNDGCSSSGRVEAGYICSASGSTDKCNSISSITDATTSFLNTNYRLTNPSVYNIIYSLFAPNTSYTQFWKNNCKRENIRLIKLLPGTDTIPQIIPDSTVYLLSQGAYSITYTSGIWFGGNCSAIISNGDALLYSTNILNTGMFFADGKANNIIDNIKIDGSKNSEGNYKGGSNNYGIYLYNSSNFTINNVYIYSHAIQGIYMTQLSINNLLNNIAVYNNTGYGIQLRDNANYNTLNNISSFNNGNAGIYVYNSYYNTINNSAFFNNQGAGLYLDNLNNIYTNNIFSFNNVGQGVYVNSNATTSNFNSITAFNNTNSGANNVGGATNRIYGILKLFNNLGNTNSFTVGGTELYASLAWNAGSLDNNGTLSCNQVVNVTNADKVDLLNGSCTTTGRVNWNPSFPIKFNYGTLVSKQTIPVMNNNGIGFVNYGLSGVDYSTKRFVTEMMAIGDSYVSSGNSGTSIYGQFFYNGIININSDEIISSSEPLNTGSCEYSHNQTNWSSASFSGNTTKGYCYVTNINLQKDFTIIFRIKTDQGNYISTKNTSFYYDNIKPIPSLTGIVNNYCDSTTWINAIETGVGVQSLQLSGNLFNRVYIETGLALLYHFDKSAIFGETNSLVKDFSSNNLAGSVNGAKRTVNGKYSGSYIFDGSNNDITSQPINLGSGVTISVWAKSLTPDGRMPWSIQTNAGLLDLFFSCSTISLNTNDSCSNPFKLTGTNVAIPTSDSWHQYTTIIDGITSKAHLYIDGKYAGEAIYRNPTSANKVMTVGGLAGYKWNGQIDEFKVYNYALSDSEVKDLYTKTDILTQLTNTGWIINHYTCGIWNYEYDINVKDILGQAYRSTGYFLAETRPEAQTGTYQISFTGDTSTQISSGNTFNEQSIINSSNPLSISTTFDDKTYNFYNSGLLLMYNFDNVAALGESGTLIADLSVFKNNAVPNGAKRTSTGKYNGSYGFDGTNNYINTLYSLTGLGKVATLSFRVKMPTQSALNTQILAELSSNSNGTDAFMVDFNKYEVGKIAANMHSAAGYSTVIASGRYDDNQRHHVLIEYDRTQTSATGQTKFYIDGNAVSGSVYGTNNKIHTTDFLSYQMFIGARDSGASPYSGHIDEFFVYNRILSADEREFLYKVQFSKYDYDKWLITTSRQCLNEGNHDYRVYIKDLAGNTYITGYVIPIVLPPMSVGTPSSGLNIPKLNISNQAQEVSFDFTGNNDYFRINDTKGHTGWNTTIQLSDDLLGQENTGNKIGKENVYFKVQSGINVLGGAPTLNIDVATGAAEYQALSGVLNVIQKHAGPTCNSCTVGTYGVLPSLKINIPSYQVPDTYNGTLIFTIYN